MHRSLLVSLFALMAYTLSSVQAQTAGVAPPSSLFAYTVLYYPAIVVARFDTLGPPEKGRDQTYFQVKAHVRVTQVLRDADGLGLRPCEVDVPVPMSVFGIRPAFWNSRRLQTGHAYILFSRSGGGVPSIIAQPDGAEMIAEGVDAVGDVQLALKENGLPIAEQANTVALALSDGKLHSSIASLAAVLLASGSDADTVQLRRVLEGDGTAALSDAAKAAMLSPLRLMVHSVAVVSDNLISVYVHLCIRYFIMDAHEGKRGPIDVQGSLLQTDIPEIRASARGLAVLRSIELSPQDRETLRREASRRMGDPFMSPKARAEAGHLLDLFPAR